MRNLRKTILCAVLLLTALILFACKDAEKPQEEQGTAGSTQDVVVTKDTTGQSEKSGTGKETAAQVSSETKESNEKSRYQMHDEYYYYTLYRYHGQPGWKLHAKRLMSGEVVVPAEFNDKPVWIIDDDCFNGQEKITEITVPENIAIIGNQAFSGCKSLEKISLPTTLRTIRSFAFEECDELTELCLPEGLEELEQDAVLRCKKLTRIALPSTLKKLGECFYGCPVDTVEIADVASYCLCEGRVRVFDEGCKRFVGGEEIGDLVLPEGLTEIKLEGAFAYWDLTSVVFPEGLTKIAKNAFCATPLTSVTLPEGLKIVGEYAFSFCSSLGKVDFPSTLGKIEGYAFCECPLTHIDLPSSLKRILTGAFADTKLTKVVLPEGLNYLYKNAFDTDTLKILVLPESIWYFSPYDIAPNLEMMVYRGTESMLVSISAYRIVTDEKGVTKQVNIRSSKDMPPYFCFASDVAWEDLETPAATETPDETSDPTPPDDPATPTGGETEELTPSDYERSVTFASWQAYDEFRTVSGRSDEEIDEYLEDIRLSSPSRAILNDIENKEDMQKTVRRIEAKTVGIVTDPYFELTNIISGGGFIALSYNNTNKHAGMFPLNNIHVYVYDIEGEYSFDLDKSVRATVDGHVFYRSASASMTNTQVFCGTVNGKYVEIFCTGKHPYPEQVISECIVFKKVCEIE